MKLSQNLKRILCLSASALMLFSVVGAFTNSINASAKHRTRITRVRKRHHIRRRNKRHYRIRRNKHHKRNVRRHHEPVYLWYFHNGHKLYKKNINTSKMFRMGYNDGIDNNNGYTPMSYKNEDTGGTADLSEMTVLNTNYVHNKKYRTGWIIGCATDSADAGTQDGEWGSDFNGSASDYKNTLRDYHQGKIFAKNNKTNLISVTDGTWSNVNSNDND